MKERLFSLLIFTLCFFSGWGLGKMTGPRICIQHAEIIEKEAQAFSLDPRLVRSLVLTESSGKSNSVSHKNAIGLMQLTPGTAKELALKLEMKCNLPDDLFRPEVNIHLGCYYLHKLLRKFRGDLVLTLAAYNTGPNRVTKWCDKSRRESSWRTIYQNGSRETKTYVYKVLGRYGKSEYLK